MYERSAIVLEKYIEKILRLDKTYNLNKNSENYASFVNQIDNFQITMNKDIKVIQEFDDTVRTIENIQREQEKIYKENKKLEEDRVKLFGELGEDAKVLENRLKNIENEIEKNNETIKQLREDFIQNLKDFSQKQKDRNKCDKERRVSEAKNIKYREEMNALFQEIDIKDIANLKDFIASEKEQVKQEALEIMIKNGKNEKIPFNQDVLRKAINNRIDIAEKEAQCYITIYDKMKKLLAEGDSETIKLDKYKKTLRDTTVKLSFLKAQKEYIVGFLDYERMTSISGPKVHRKMMLDACNNFELDMMQIKKLYELILKEIAGKATQKVYNDLYNKNYLKNIEDKEKNFEEEANNVNLKSGTLINSNYWRIEGIKNIYTVFHKEISEKFQKDLTEYRMEELDEQDEAYDNVDEYDQEYENEDDQYYEDDDNYEEDNYEEDSYEDESYEEETYEENDYEENSYEEDDYEQNQYENSNTYEKKYKKEKQYEYARNNNVQYDNNQYNDNQDDEYEEEYDYSSRENEAIQEFEDDDIDNIIKNSRKKATQKSSSLNRREKTSKNNVKDNKGIFNKFFKK